jgi:predicted nicotinamide N-methyase
MQQNITTDGTTDWERIMYHDEEVSIIGKRLGVSYMRSTMEYIDLTVNGHSMKLYQSSMGIMAISGVVWDAGLFLADYMLAYRDLTFGCRVLDLGCGTGVCGITAVLLGASVTFSDISEPPSFDDNIGQLSDELRERHEFVSFDWSQAVPCPELISPRIVNSQVSPCELPWDTVFCSDVLYDQKAHNPLLRLLKQIKFNKLIISYKKRHDAPEKEFFRALSLFCSIEVVLPGTFQLQNLCASSTSGLYIIIANKRAISH